MKVKLLNWEADGEELRASGMGYSYHIYDNGIEVRAVAQYGQLQYEVVHQGCAKKCMEACQNHFADNLNSWII